MIEELMISQAVSFENVEDSNDEKSRGKISS
jgi:hypothetical protein